MDPVDFSEINVKARNLLNVHREDDITINLTSGTKAWTIAFAAIGQGMNDVTLLYIDQNCTFYDYTHVQKWNKSNTYDIETLMRFNGQSPQSHMQLNDYTNDDLKILAKIKRIRRTNYRSFNRLTIPDKKRKRQLDSEITGEFIYDDDHSYIQWDKPSNTVSISLNTSWGFQTTVLRSPNCVKMVFDSGWFEYEVAEMLSHWQQAHDVWMNVVYPYRAGNAKNEIDVIVNTGTKLLMVECKTQIFDNTDIDKFNTAVKNYGGMGTKSLFITDSNMREDTKEKCLDSHIMTFCMKDYKNKKEAEQALFAMLDNELKTINPR